MKIITASELFLMFGISFGMQTLFGIATGQSFRETGMAFTFSIFLLALVRDG